MNATDPLNPNPGYAAFRHRMDAVITGYIECALWSELCKGTAVDAVHGHYPCDGEECDRSLSHDLNFDIDDLSPAAARDMEADVEDFVKACLSERPACFDGIADDMIGHDFWLTRNGHGAGFWDRGLGELGKWLTAMSKPYGESSLYVHAGQVHVG